MVKLEELDLDADVPGGLVVVPLVLEEAEVKARQRGRRALGGRGAHEIFSSAGLGR